MTHPTDSAAQIIANLAERVAEGEQRQFVAKDIVDAAPLVFHRDGEGGLVITDLSTRRVMPPHRKHGTIMFYDAKSFMSYFEQHNAESAIYATMHPHPVFIAVFNEHTSAKAGFRDHRAHFQPSFSSEWTTWAKRNGRNNAFSSNEEFASFLQQNAPDIVQPSPADMLSIALNFRVKSDTSFKNAIRLTDGNTEFQFDNVVNAESIGSTGGKVSIPDRFSLRIPVFDGLHEPSYTIDAMFNFRTGTGERKLTLWYDLVRPQKIVQQAFKDIWTSIEERTQVEILHGQP